MKPKGHQTNRRDAGAFIQVPLAVLNSTAYKNLSGSAKVLLWDVVGQYKGDNNGRLLTGWKIMSEDRLWVSKATLSRAKSELLKSGLLFETRKGARPNKSSWCAATWWHINWIIGMDMREQEFPRGLYRDNDIVKNTSLSTDSVHIKSA